MVKIRAVKKEQKHYHFDWSLVQDMPRRFENMVASHLLKWVHYEEDTKGRNIELRYFRDIEGKEVEINLIFNKQKFPWKKLESNGLGMGLGIRILGVQTDYSFVPYGELGNTYRFSLTSKF